MTAAILAVVITLAGHAIFDFMHITVNDLRVGGGIILLVIAIYDLVFSSEERKGRSVTAEAGVVPLGTPIIMGPAGMTACVVLADTRGTIPTLVGVLSVLLLVWLILRYARTLSRLVNAAVSRAFGKVMSLFLAAIAIAMIRAGIFGMAEMLP